MLCQGCDQTMQRETVVRVLRAGLFGRVRSSIRPGWHCWNCRISRVESTSPASMDATANVTVACAKGRTDGKMLRYLVALDRHRPGYGLGESAAAG